MATHHDQFGNKKWVGAETVISTLQQIAHHIYGEVHPSISATLTPQSV